MINKQAIWSMWWSYTVNIDDIMKDIIWLALLRLLLNIFTELQLYTNNPHHSLDKG
jgi:hypothetical protein